MHRCLLAVPLLAIIAARTTPFAPSADERAIRAARIASNHAIAAHDADATASVMRDDYLSVSSTNARNIGRSAARASYAQIFASRPGVVFVRTPTSIAVNARWGQAAETGRWTGEWRAADGTVRVGGSYFAKWVRSDSTWKLIAETFVQTSCAGAHYCDAAPDIPRDTAR